ncbi:ferric reductase NAD binding domain-containing protein [Pyronema omphalodes]|nr:ferric reductase NAD binding domain-containing protein [Pyronema omphalodes]
MNGMNMNGMKMGSGSTTTSLVGLTKPILWHSSRIAACTMTPEQCAWKTAKWRNWYRADLDYAHAMVIFMCVTIAFFAGIQLLSRISNARIRRSHLGKRVLGSYRYLSYRSWYLRAFDWYSPSLGIILIGVIGFVFSITLLLAVKPYYWPNTKGPHAISFGSSPPIATRAGWMSLALLPFIMALSAKQNLITLLTGVSHEKLQIFHQWASYAMLILALAHTFPFIVYHIWLGDMMMQYSMTIWYWTGIAALIPQAYLTLFPRFLRSRYYEFFKLSHFVAAPLFLVFLFLHCNFRLTSWDYFIATVCIYGASLLVSWARGLSNGMHTATVEILNGGLVGVTMKSKVRWNAGAHVFVRLLSGGLSTSVSAHPFSIASFPNTGKEGSEIKLFIKPHRGITGRLQSMAANQPNRKLTATISGPYGGLPGSFKEFNSILVLVGGSGGSVVVPMLEHFITSNAATEIHIVWAVKSKDAISWFEQELLRLQIDAAGKQITVKISIHVTGAQSAEPASVTNENEAEKKDLTLAAASEEPVSGMTVLYGRPEIPGIVMEASEKAKAVGIVACGPPGMILDAQNAAAALQLQIVMGTATVEEVALHTERFSW